jgi:hypothetical protein
VIDPVRGAERCSKIVEMTEGANGDETDGWPCGTECIGHVGHCYVDCLGLGSRDREGNAPPSLARKPKPLPVVLCCHVCCKGSDTSNIAGLSVSRRRSVMDYARPYLAHLHINSYARDVAAALHQNLWQCVFAGHLHRCDTGSSGHTTCCQWHSARVCFIMSATAGSNSLVDFWVTCEVLLLSWLQALVLQYCSQRLMHARQLTESGGLARNVVVLEGTCTQVKRKHPPCTCHW